MSSDTAPTICADREALFRHCADRLVALASTAINERGQFRLVLSGGSTPQGFYQLLATPDYRDRIDWSRCHIYFGDERYVPHSAVESNYRMAREALLDHINIPTDHIHPIATGSTPDEDASHYHRLLADLVEGHGEPPQLDLVLLGIGNDGHTASLFPGSPVLDEQQRLAAALYLERLGSWRITLTYPVLNAARHCWVMATGQAKAAIIKQAVSVVDDSPLPIQRISARNGIEWFIDRAAATELLET